MAGSKFLEGEKVTLRTVEEEDLEFLRDNVNDPQVRKPIGSRKPYNLKQEQDFFEGVVSDGDSVNLLIWAGDDESEERRAGIISLDNINQESGHAEIGLWLTPEEWGHGYATEASKLVTNYGFDQLRLHRIQARVFDFNDASKRVWEKLGFVKEGVHRERYFIDGEYFDVHYYAVLKDEWGD
ncbi:MAG: GNAT family protein [Halobacteria archaeon]|nr:GNAT family protein [Halobacteria archaeon]